MARLSSTESTIVDLVALRNWHFKASMDSGRTPEMRRWHRSQVKHISRKLDRTGWHTRNVMKVAFIEFLAGKYRERLHSAAGKLAPFAWEKFCEAAKRELARDGHRSPSNSRP